MTFTISRRFDAVFLTENAYLHDIDFCSVMSTSADSRIDEWVGR